MDDENHFHLVRCDSLKILELFPNFYNSNEPLQSELALLPILQIKRFPVKKI